MPKAGLFTIGEFSAITGIGIHSLRYYDEIGALKPEYVDPTSNYRYYGFRQLSRIPAINLCKDAGISLSSFDSFLINDTVDYNRLIDESRRSLELKINSYRLKQKELEQLQAFYAVEQALNGTDELSMHIDDIKVRIVPYEDGFCNSDASGLFRSISAEAKKQGQHITSTFCGLMQTTETDGQSLHAFTQTFGDYEIQDDEMFAVIPSGEYRIVRTDSFDIKSASELLCDSDDSICPDTIITIAFICDAPKPLFCAAALIG